MTKRVADMTPEELKRRNACRAKREAALTDEEREARRIAKRVSQQKWLAKELSDEGREARRIAKCASQQKWVANMSAEQREKRRLRALAYDRRERAEQGEKLRARWRANAAAHPERSLQNYYRHHEKNKKRSRRYYYEDKRKREAKLLADAKAAVPMGMPGREDIVMDIVTAVLSRSLTVADIAKRAGEFIRAHNRDNDHFKTVSLNECLPGTDLARIDTITKDDLPW
jgi:hypothetical protein